MIVNAEVFKSPNSNCYIVFGEAKTEDTAAGLGNLGGGGGGGGGFQTESMVSSGKQAAGKISATDLDDESGEVDETGVSAKDIETVMTQVNCTRKKAGQPDLDPDSESEQEMSFALFDDESVKLPNPPPFHASGHRAWWLGLALDSQHLADLLLLVFPLRALASQYARFKSRTAI